MIRAISARIASACGPIFGRSQISVRSTLPSANPRSPANPRHGSEISRSPRLSTPARSAENAARYRPRPARRRSRRSPHASPHRRPSALQPAPVRHLDAAEHHVVSRPEAVHVKPVAQPDIHLIPCKIRAALVKSLACVSLRFSSSPATSATSIPAASATSTSSAASPGNASCAARIALSSNPCGVCARQSPSRTWGASTRAPSARQSASVTGRAGAAACACSSAEITCDISGFDTSGLAPSWIRTWLAPSGRAANPARTDAARLAPPVTTVTPSGSTRLGQRRILRGDHHGHACHFFMRQEDGDRPRHHGHVNKFLVLLRNRAARPGPAPGGDDQRGDMWASGRHANPLRPASAGGNGPTRRAVIRPKNGQTMTGAGFLTAHPLQSLHIFRYLT